MDGHTPFPVVVGRRQEQTQVVGKGVGLATTESRIINGDSAEVLKTIDSNTIDAVITDPPYGIEFLAKDWDSNTGAVEIWQECLRVLKPGGFLLAFSAARTYHKLATNIESAGFEIRDQIMWLYASGFPKAQKIKGFPGWKTQLKPAHEPICMARKPVKGPQYKNMAKYGVGALNIDASRIPYKDAGKINPCIPRAGRRTASFSFGNKETHAGGDGSPEFVADEKGRFPSNVIGEVEGYQKFFYCPKVSRKERHKGFEKIPDPISNYTLGDVKNHPLWDKSIGTNLQRLKHKIMEHNRDVGPSLDHIPAPFGDVKGCYKDGERFAAVSDKEGHAEMGNNHPTVKPVALMKYLVRLVTPLNTHILDPFAGSGSTGMACRELGRSFTGIEQDPAYCDIATRRIRATKTDPKNRLFE